MTITIAQLNMIGYMIAFGVLVGAMLCIFPKILKGENVFGVIDEHIDSIGLKDRVWNLEFRISILEERLNLHIEKQEQQDDESPTA